MIKNISVMVSLCACLLFGNHANGEVAVGDDVPAYELKGSDGKTYSSEQFKKNNKVVVIAWYPRAFTGGCTKECKSLRDSSKALQQFDVTYFTASCDTVEKNTDFAKSLDLNYPILSDPTKEFAKALGCLSSRGAASRWTYYIGGNGKILHIDKKVKVSSHGEAIAAKLEELGIKKKP